MLTGIINTSTSSSGRGRGVLQLERHTVRVPSRPETQRTLYGVRGTSRSIGYIAHELIRLDLVTRTLDENLHVLIDSAWHVEKCGQNKFIQSEQRVKGNI
jgi:hypothetical protein